MSETMNFPETFDEFAENYKITDDKQVYTNGTELIPIFRVRQWLMRPDENAKTVEQIKSEAIKEFAERLKDHSRKMQSSDFSGDFWDEAVDFSGDTWDEAVLVEDIDELVKEMVGENNE